MPRTKLSDEQKLMIRELPPREKDKLLLRLIAKDQLLLEQLTFKYIELEATTEERTEEFRDFYRRLLGHVQGQSPGMLMMRLRQASGYLTRHVRVTKDKLGEVLLFVEMVHYALDENIRPMQKRYPSMHRWYKLAVYVSKRLPTVMRKAHKLHPDLWIEFEPQLNDLLQLIHDTPQLNAEAERLELPRRWEPEGV